MTDEEREFISEIERRKELREGICEACDGSGSSKWEGHACLYCLGQGIILTAEEHALLFRIEYRSRPDDETYGILNEQELP